MQSAESASAAPTAAVPALPTPPSTGPQPVADPQLPQTPASEAPTDPTLSPPASATLRSLSEALVHAQHRLAEMQDEQRRLQSQLLEKQQALMWQAHELAERELLQQETVSLRSRCVAVLHSRASVPVLPQHRCCCAKRSQTMSCDLTMYSSRKDRIVGCTGCFASIYRCRCCGGMRIAFDRPTRLSLLACVV